MTETISIEDFPGWLKERLSKFVGDYQVCLRMDGKESDHNVALIDAQSKLIQLRVCAPDGTKRADPHAIKTIVSQVVCGQEQFPDKSHNNTWKKGIKSGRGWVMLSVEDGEPVLARYIA